MEISLGRVPGHVPGSVPPSDFIALGLRTEHQGINPISEVKQGCHPAAACLLCSTMKSFLKTNLLSHFMALAAAGSFLVLNACGPAKPTPTPTPTPTPAPTPSAAETAKQKAAVALEAAKEAAAASLEAAKEEAGKVAEKANEAIVNVKEKGEELREEAKKATGEALTKAGDLIKSAGANLLGDAPDAPQESPAPTAAPEVPPTASPAPAPAPTTGVPVQP